MALLVEENESPDPLNISLFRSPAHVFATNDITHLIEQARRLWDVHVSTFSLQLLSDNPLPDMFKQWLFSQSEDYLPITSQCSWTLLGDT
jgi:hypothetical protein